jgi:hypothetical protein
LFATTRPFIASSPPAIVTARWPMGEHDREQTQRTLKDLVVSTLTA